MGTTPSAHVLMVQVPDTLYDRLAQRAARTQRSVEQATALLKDRGYDVSPLLQRT
jgi:hypothetical protein